MFTYLMSFIKGSLKGLRPFKNSPSPSPFKERGIKGVRLKTSYLNPPCPLTSALGGARAG